jgi:hypothetical protein
MGENAICREPAVGLPLAFADLRHYRLGVGPTSELYELHAQVLCSERPERVARVASSSRAFSGTSRRRACTQRRRGNGTPKLHGGRGRQDSSQMHACAGPTAIEELGAPRGEHRKLKAPTRRGPAPRALVNQGTTVSNRRSDRLCSASRRRHTRRCLAA